MKKIFTCRRTIISLFSVTCLTFLGAYTKQDVSGIAIAIAGICSAVCAANSYENVGKAKVGVDQSSSTKAD